MQSIYRPIIKQAVLITWKFKYLWFFGLFAALAGNGGVYNFLFNNLEKAESRAASLVYIKAFFSDFGRFFSSDIDWAQMMSDFSFWTAVALVILFVAVIFLIWLSISSQGALVHAAGKHFKNIDNGFKLSFSYGSSKFWPLLLLNIFTKIIISAALLVISIPFVLVVLNGEMDMFWQNMFTVLSFIILIPVAAILAFIVKYALIYVVNRDQHVGLALKNGWFLFKQNWVASLEMALVLFIINLVSSLVLLIVMVIAAIPFVLLGFVAGYITSVTLLWTVIVVAILVMIAIVFVYGAVLNVFQNSCWVILFEKLSLGGVYSKVLRWGASFLGNKKNQASPN